jgi:hypothetical protein
VVRIETRRAGPSDLDRAAFVLGEAFADYPWTRWTVDSRDHEARVTGLQRLTLEHVGLAVGDVWVTTVDDVIESVAIWTDSATIEDFTPDPALDRLAAELEGSRHEASVLAERQVADWRPAERHLFLGTVGTAPRMCGLGLASGTLMPTLSAADTDGVPAFLETSSTQNIEFYSTLRFEVIDHRRITGGGPDVWAMLRPPLVGGRL